MVMPIRRTALWCDLAILLVDSLLILIDSLHGQVVEWVLPAAMMFLLVVLLLIIADS